MKEELLRLHYDITSGDFNKGGEASSNLKRALLQIGINANIIKRICIASYEAEMNVVIHSNGGYLDAIIYEDSLEVIVKDNGPGINNIGLAMKEGYSTASERAREMGFGAGMGLPNMKRSCDEFEIKSVPFKYTEVTMKVNFN